MNEGAGISNRESGGLGEGGVVDSQVVRLVQRQICASELRTTTRAARGAAPPGRSGLAIPCPSFCVRILRKKTTSPREKQTRRVRFDRWGGTRREEGEKGRGDAAAAGIWDRADLLFLPLRPMGRHVVKNPLFTLYKKKL